MLLIIIKYSYPLNPSLDLLPNQSISVLAPSNAKKKSSKNKPLCHETDWISLILLVEWGVQSNYQCPPNGDQTD